MVSSEDDFISKERTESESDQKPEGSNTSKATKKDNSMSRSERKRCQEKRRRHEFKEVMDKLLSILLQYDEDFLAESKQRESLLATRRVTNRQTSTNADSDNGLFNRIELVNQASFTIKRLARENAEYKELIQGLRAEGKQIPIEFTSPERKEKRPSYHRGVGPVAVESTPDRALESQASLNKTLQKTNENSNDLAAKLRMISAMQQQQRQQLLEGSLNSIDAQTLASLAAVAPAASSDQQHTAAMNLPLLAAMNQQQQQQQGNLHLIQQMVLEQQRRELLESQLMGTISPMVATSMHHQNLAQQSNQTTAAAVRNNQGQDFSQQTPESLLMLLNNLQGNKFDPSSANERKR